MRCGNSGAYARSLAFIVLPIAVGQTAVTCAVRADSTAIAADSTPAVRTELWVGASATQDAWSVYSGATTAPFAAGLLDDGIRLRSTAAYGHYRYTFTSGLVPVANAVDVKIVDTLIGYQGSDAWLTWKIFAGVTAVEQRPRLADPGNQLLGQEVGGKGAVELWLNWSETAWTSLDAAYASVHETLSVRWRGGWRPDGRAWGPLSIGPEAAFDRNVEGNSVQAGAFVRYQWTDGEASIASGGVSDAVTIGDGNGWQAYGTANVLFKF